MSLLSYLSDLFGSATHQIKADIALFCIGNIGQRYEGTRHNVGFAVADGFIKICGKSPTIKSRFADIHICECGDKKIAVVKPTTFVNKSGDAFADCIKTGGFTLDQCLVVVDDYNLPLGAIRLRRGGSDGGHNGLKSIIQAAGEGFPRMRIGIGPKPKDQSTIDFVLGTFSKEEQKALEPVIDRAIHGIKIFFTDGAEKASSVVNKVPSASAK